MYAVLLRLERTANLIQELVRMGNVYNGDTVKAAPAVKGHLLWAHDFMDEDPLCMLNGGNANSIPDSHCPVVS